MCRCPCHDDRIKSLSVHAATKQGVFPPVVLKCHGPDCSQDMLVSWCKEQGLWPKPERPLPMRYVNFRPRRARQTQEDELQEDELQEDEQQANEQQANEQQANEQQDDDDHRSYLAYYLLRNAARHAQKHPDARNQLLPYFNGRGVKQVPASAMYLPRNVVYELAQRYPRCGLPPGAPGFPVMIQPTGDASRRLRGALITVLTQDGKTNLREDGKSMRRIVGPSRHAFVQVSGIFDRDRPLLVAEGVEKAAAVATELFKQEDYPAIAVLGVANMKNAMPLPPCAEVWIAADNGAAGSRAAKAMAAHVKRAGGTARIVLPPEQFKDWDRAIRAADSETLASYREMFLSAAPFEGEDGEAAPDDLALLAPTVAEVLTLEIPPLEYLMEPWLTTSSIGELHAQRGVGKTRLAMAVAHALASGQNFLRWTVKRPVRVLYVDGELPAALLQQRLRLLGPPSANLHIVSRDLLLRQNLTLPDLRSEEGRAFLDRIIEALHIEVIFLDSLSTLIHSGKEVDPEDWMPIQQWLMGHRFRRRAIMFLHHEGWKAGQARGTSKREDTIDYTIGLEAKNSVRDDEVVFQLNFGKKRELYGKDAASLLLHLTTKTETTEWRHEFARDRSHEQIAELKRQGMKQTEIAKELRLSKGQVSKVFNKLKGTAGGAEAEREEAD